VFDRSRRKTPLTFTPGFYKHISEFAFLPAAKKGISVELEVQALAHESMRKVDEFIAIIFLWRYIANAVAAYLIGRRMLR